MRYLRLLAQHTLNSQANDGVFQYRPEVVAAAAALVAVDELSVDEAQAVIYGHYQVMTGQSENNVSGSTAATEPASVETADRPTYGFERWRVVPVDSTIEQRWGQLHIEYVVFDERATVLRASMRATRLPPPTWRTIQNSPTSIAAWLPGSPDLPRFLEIANDTGTTSIAEFAGNRTADDPTWRGSFEAPPLPPETAWISLLGERVELNRTPTPTQSWAEPLPWQDPAHRHLWERVATRNDFHDQRAALEATIAALVACGRLKQDDPLFADARATVQVLTNAQVLGQPEPLQHTRQRVPSSGLMPPLSSRAPQAWRSLMSRWGRIDSPTGTVVVGAVTPIFDGIKAAVTAIRSGPQCFGIGVVIAPDLRIGLPYRSLDHRRHLTWWAVDDQENYSLAESGSWDSQGNRAVGRLLFWPGIDPRATWIDLMPTAEMARGVIRVPLPWAR